MGLTLPNQLTLFRMVLIPFLVVAVLYGHFGWAFVLFLMAGVTDALDGLIARLTRQKSALGAFLDPLADKLLMTAVFVVLSLPPLASLPHFQPANRVPIWLAVLVIGRDVLIVLVALLFNLAFNIKRFPPTLPGKLTTGAQVLTVSFFLFFNALAISSLVMRRLWIAVCLVATVGSGLHYAWHAARNLAADVDGQSAPS
ncbi:MAG: CDP-alcohol phosphatidyltransferase family protein [Acidobacteriota bacterium]